MTFSLLLRNPNFRYLYLGQIISFFGTMITTVAIPYQIYHLTQSTFMVGFLSLLQLIPLIFTALIGGVFADRYHRRLLLLTTEILLSIGCAALALNSYFHPQVWVIFVAGILMSAVTGLHRPALDSLTQQLVTRNDYAQVGALTTFKFSVGMIAGPYCDGQVLVSYDILGLSGPPKKFVKNYMEDSQGSIAQAIECYVKEVHSGQFPTLEHCFE